MLGKLLKYEWRATSRTLLPLYGGVLLMALINRLFWGIGFNYQDSHFLQEILGMTATFVYAGLICASFVVTFVLLVQRFYKSLLGDEGYLMFTLPATAAQHIWAKTIIAFVMCILSGVTTGISVMLLTLNPINLQFFTGDMIEMIKILFDHPSWIGIGIEGIVFCILAMISTILSIYVCIAIGHLAKKHRIAGAIGAYFAISIVTQIIVTLFMMGSSGTGVDQFFTNLTPTGMAHLFFLVANVAMIVESALYFFFTRLILTRHLNLE